MDHPKDQVQDNSSQHATLTQDDVTVEGFLDSKEVDPADFQVERLSDDIVAINSCEFAAHNPKYSSEL